MNRLYFSIVWQISKLMAGILNLFIGKEIQANLDLVYGQGKVEVQKYLAKMARYLLEVLNLNHLSKKNINQFFDLPLELLRKNLESKRGLMLLVMHAGNWEMLAASMALSGLPINAIVNSRDNYFEKLLDKKRLKNGIKLINIQQDNLFRGCLKAFQNNEITMIAADTGATDSDKNIELNFLQHKLPVAYGWATIAKRANCLVLPLFPNNQGGFQHKVIVGETLDPQNFASEEDLVKKALGFYEKNLADNPTEWFLPLSTSEVRKTFK